MFFDKLIYNRQHGCCRIDSTRTTQTASSNNKHVIPTCEIIIHILEVKHAIRMINVFTSLNIDFFCKHVILHIASCQVLYCILLCFIKYKFGLLTCIIIDIQSLNAKCILFFRKRYITFK